MAKKKWKNPFYTLLIPVGLAFVVTGFAYGFMAFQAVNSGASAAETHADHPLYLWLHENGDYALLAQLALLAVLTVGAIATDDWWMQETDASESAESPNSNSPDPQEGDSQGDD